MAGRKLGAGLHALAQALLTTFREALALMVKRDSDSNSSTMSEKRQAGHSQAQQVPESFRGESLVPGTVALSPPLGTEPPACSENPADDRVRKGVLPRHCVYFSESPSCPFPLASRAGR